MSTKQMGPAPLPPGPAEPFDVNADLESFELMNRGFERYGDLYQVKPLRRERPTYVASHPDLVQHVLASNRRNYVKGIGFELVKMLLGNGLIVSDGDHWLKQRRMIQPAFHRDNIERMAEVVRAANVRRLEVWEGHAASGEPIDITQDASELALEIILGSIFGNDLSTFENEDGSNPFSLLIEHTERDLALVVKFRALRKLVARLIEERRSEDRTPERPDFLSLYMQARDRETSEAMAEKDLIDEIMTIVVAGHETTAATVNWVWYLLSGAPDVERKVHAEVDALPSSGAPGFEDLGRLPYTKRVMYEALRLYPPVWLFTRRAVEADVLGGYRVDPGTDILLSPWIVHRHPDFWDDPEAFRPERFTETGVNERHDYAYFPFSMGPRRCTGDFFATVEVLTHVGLMARRFRLRYAPDRPLELEPGVNLRSKYGIKMVIEKRQSQS